MPHADYAPDAFDEVPYNASRRGVHRGDRHDRLQGRGELIAIIFSGALALLLGGVMFMAAPRLSAPESPEAPVVHATDPASDGAAVSPARVGLGVYNDGAVEGTATEAAADLRREGWTVEDVADWDGSAVEGSMVLYTGEHREQAEAVAQTLGLEQVRKESELEYGVVVVMAGP